MAGAQGRGPGAAWLGHPFRGKHVPCEAGRLPALSAAKPLQRPRSAGNTDRGHARGAEAGQRRNPKHPAASGHPRYPGGGQAGHPASQSPGQQPRSGVCGLPEGTGVPPVQRTADLSQCQQPPFVPLLRLFRSRAGPLPQLRRPSENPGHGDPAGAAGAERAVPGRGGGPHGCGHRQCQQSPRGDPGPVPPGRAEDPAGHPDGCQGAGYAQCDLGGRPGCGSEPFHRRLPGRGDHL